MKKHENDRNITEDFSDLVFYPALFEKDGSYIMVTFPDFGYSTEGSSIGNAIMMARDLLGGTLESLDKSNYPAPSLFDEVIVNEGQYLVFVDLRMDEYRRKSPKMVRRNVTIPDYLDKMAESQKVNVSDVLTKALKEKFGI